MPATKSYAIGVTVRLSVTFDNGAIPPVLTDPTTVTLRVKDPDGVTVVYSSTTNDGVGLYHQDISVPLEGWWTYRWEGIGTVEESIEKELFVRLSSILP